MIRKYETYEIIKTGKIGSGYEYLIGRDLSKDYPYVCVEGRFSVYNGKKNEFYQQVRKHQTYAHALQDFYSRWSFDHAQSLEKQGENAKPLQEEEQEPEREL